MEWHRVVRVRGELPGNRKDDAWIVVRQRNVAWILIFRYVFVLSFAMFLSIFLVENIKMSAINCMECMKCSKSSPWTRFIIRIIRIIK